MNITRLERKPGVWRLRVETRDDEGKRAFRYKTVRGGKRDVDRAEARLRVALEAGDAVQGDEGAPGAGTTPSALPLPGTGPLVGAWAEQWLTEREVLGNLAPSSTVTYRAHVAHIVRVWGKTPLGDLTRSHVMAGLVTLAGTLSPRMVRHVHSRLWSILAEARERGMVAGNVAHRVKLPQAPETRGRALTPQEMRAILDAALKHRLGPIVRFALATGLRRGEIAALTWDDITLDKKRSVSVTKSLVQMGSGGVEHLRPPKSEAGVRVVSLPKAAAEELRARRAKVAKDYDALGMVLGEQPVFVNADGVRWKAGRLGDALSAFLHNVAKVDISAHDLRHAHATELLRGGMNVRAVATRLGHSDPMVTLKIYGHVLPADDERLAQHIDEVMK